MIPMGFSQRAIIREIRRLGYGYRTGLMNEDIRRFSGRFLNEHYVKKLRPDEIVPRGLMVETTLKRPVKYHVFGDVTYWDRETDTYLFEPGSLHTDNLRSKADWEADYIEKSPRPKTDPRYEVVGFDITAVEHYEGYIY
jgi:hypothetical protein